MAASEEWKHTLNKHASYGDAEGATMSSCWNKRPSCLSPSRAAHTRTRQGTISEGYHGPEMSRSISGMGRTAGSIRKVVLAEEISILMPK